MYIYIMGRGHSGSTILDALLGSAENMHSLGEIVSGMPRKEDVCSCGNKIKDCEFWNKVRAKFEEENDISWNKAALKLQNQAHLKYFIKTWLGINRREIEELKEINETLFGIISEVAESEVLIDSSKEFTRGLFLTKYLSPGKIIHLIRNPLDILASTLLRIGEGKFKFLRYKFKNARIAFPFLMISACSWMAGNLLGEIIHYIGKDKIMRVRYEDLSSEPSVELAKIGRFVGQDLRGVVRRVKNGEKMNIPHMIAGNRMRTKGSFIFAPNKKDYRPLPKRYRLMGILITWPLMLKYGYLHLNQVQKATPQTSN